MCLLVVVDGLQCWSSCFFTACSRWRISTGRTSACSTSFGHSPFSRRHRIMAPPTTLVPITSLSSAQVGDHSMPLLFLTSLFLMCLSPSAMTPPSYYHHHEIRDTPLSLSCVTPPRSTHIGDQLSRHNIHLQQPSPPPPTQVSHTVVANIPGFLVLQHFERE